MSIEIGSVLTVAFGLALFGRRKHGTRILQAASAGVEPARSIVDAARREGATDEDIREWWDFSEKNRQRILVSENTFRYSVFLSEMEEGKSSDEAALTVKRTFPIYGRTGDREAEMKDRQACKELGLTEESRMLPPELRGRVDVYRKKLGATRILSLSNKYESYNAFLRDEIRNGRI